MKAFSKIDLDLATYKIQIHDHDWINPLVICFDTPARRFYFSLIALIVNEMKNHDKQGFVYIRKHEDILRRLDNAISGKHASKHVNDMWAKIRMAWRHRLPDLEKAALFKIENRDVIRHYEKRGKYRYDCTEEESDAWANLFDFDEANIWRFKFAIDSISLDLEDVQLSLGDLRDQSAWQEYVTNLKPRFIEKAVETKEHFIRCHACGSENLPGSLYCSACSQNLKTLNKDHTIVFDRIPTHPPIVAVPKVPADQSVIEGERKVVTVLCVEFFNIPQLSEAHDPEEMHTLMSFLFNILNDHIHTHNGTINQFAEDEVMALFGAPTAQEDHAKHACYAALAIQNALTEKTEEIERRFGVKLSLRMGLNSGLVVAGTIGGETQRMYTAIGNTIYIAHQVKNLAAPGAIMVSAHTYPLVKDYFELTSFSYPTNNRTGAKDEAYQLVRAGTYESRIQVAGVKGFTKFVGRKNTMTRLFDAYEKASAGSSQVVSLYGEAGAGKSRVLQEFTKRLPQGEFLYLEGKCVHHGISMPYLPVLDILRNYFDIQSQDSDHLIQEKIDAQSKDLESLREESTEFLKALLSGTSRSALSPQLNPEQRRKMTFSAIKELLYSLCLEKPLIVAVEDFHWIDRTSEDFFLHLINYLGDHKILMVIVFRPHYRFQQIGPVDCTPINLSPLTPQSSLELIQAVLGSREIDKELEGYICERSAGNPLIIEEIVYDLREKGAIEKRDGRLALSRNIEAIRLPDTIRGIIAERIDRLEETLKMIIQVSSVIGRVFSFDILVKVIGMEEGLRYHLLLLQKMDFIYEQETSATTDYIFRHALIQEVAYESLLIEQKRKIHATIGSVIESIFADRIENVYDELAYHYEASGNREKAIEYLFKAGDKANQGYANEAAISCLQRGLNLLRTFPETPERAGQELELLIALGIPLIFTKGNAAPEVETTYSRARELCEQVGDNATRFMAVLGLRRFYFARGKLRRAHELSEQLLALAQGAKDPILLSRAQMMLAETSLYRGEFALAREHAEQGIALYDPQQHQADVLLFGTDTWATCQLCVAHALWYLGYPDQALERSNEGVTLAHEISHPISIAYTMAMAAFLHQLRRDVQPAYERAEAVVALSTEKGFTLFLGWGTMVRGWALAMQSPASLEGQRQVEEGIAQMTQDLTAYRATGAEIMYPHFLALLAEVYGKIGKTGQGFSLLAEALEVVAQTGEGMHEAEIYRLKGELLRQKGENEPEAESCFDQAIEAARCRSAKSLELRAVMSLCRLWIDQGKKKEARELLQGIYSWFTEGFDTADLKEAKALLESIA